MLSLFDITHVAAASLTQARKVMDRTWLAGVLKKRTKKRIAKGRPRPVAPTVANSVWRYDLVFDVCADGQQLKCLTVVDDFTRELLANDMAGSIRSARVIEVLAKLISAPGAPPRYLRSDNGPEFVSVALLKWVLDQQIESVVIDPGKPWQNGTTESFNRKFRDECLALEWFRNRIGVKVVIEDWRQHYNTKHQKRLAGCNRRIY